MKRYKDLKEAVPEKQLKKFLPNDLFSFTDEFSNRLDAELDQVIHDFKNKNSKTQQEIENEEAYEKEVSLEKHLLEKASNNKIEKPWEGDNVRDSASQKQKFRESLLNEVDIDK